MSFNKEIYVCKICGRMDFSAERFVHVCPDIIQSEKGNDEVLSIGEFKEDSKLKDQ